MKILVCIKQVPEAEAEFTLDPASGRVRWPDDAPLRMGRYDACALEEALRLREGFPGTRVEVLSCGPERAGEAIRRALAMGADHGIHLLGAGELCRPALATAASIAGAVRDRGFDLVLAGVMSDDGMHGQVGPALAEMLAYPCITAVIGLKLAAGGVLQLQREVEGGRRQRFRLPLPALLTIQSGIHAPRYPALSHMLRSRSQVIETMAASPPAAHPGAPLLRLPPRRLPGRLLQGTAEEKARQLLAALHAAGHLSWG